VRNGNGLDAGWDLRGPPWIDDDGCTGEARNTQQGTRGHGLSQEPCSSQAEVVHPGQPPSGMADYFRVCPCSFNAPACNAGLDHSLNLRLSATALCHGSGPTVTLPDTVTVRQTDIITPLQPPTVDSWYLAWLLLVMVQVVVPHLLPT
jgi:hypothetical protein